MPCPTQRHRFRGCRQWRWPWHGYPVPWQDIPRNVRDALVAEDHVTWHETQRAVERTDIRWVLGGGDD